MDKEKVHKEVGRLMGHIASLYFEKYVTHFRNEDVIVKEIVMFEKKIHEVIDSIAETCDSTNLTI